MKCSDDIFIEMRIVLYLMLSAILLSGCASPKLVYENENSITYEHRDDKYSTLNSPDFYLASAKKAAITKCQEKGYRSFRVTNSQCTTYCAKNSECVCITNFSCQK